MIPDSFIQDILARTDIVGLIERYVSLKRSGANYAACCPFHNEKSPSFTVSPSKQFYHCFGCGAHGTAIGFLMEYCGMSFRDAVKDLAQQSGLQVPEDDAPQQDRVQLDSLIDATIRAAKFFRERLRSAPKAVEYLKQRGLTGEIAKRFGIGYAPDDWNSLRETFGRDYDSPALLEAGLVIQNDAGHRYDRFRDRVMFPIIDQRGRIIGFGGRVIGQGEPKYLNSPETPLFEKGRELYGLFQARQAIREAGVVVVTEGYMDVVALAQYGFGAAVATLGTSTTATHIQKLFRQSDRVVFCFDGDGAGRKAARRALENVLDQLADDREVRFLFLPPEHDPDSFIRAEGLEAFRRAVDDAMPLSEFLRQTLRGELNLSIPEDRARMIHEAKQLVPKISAQVLQLQTMRMLAEDTAMEVDEIALALGLRPLSRGNRKQTARHARTPRTAPARPQRQLLQLTARFPELLDRLPSDLEELLGESPEARLLQTFRDAHDHDHFSPSTLAALFETSKDDTERQLLRELIDRESDDEEADDEARTELLQAARAEFNGHLANLHIAALEHEFQSLKQRLAQGEILSPEEMHRYALLPTAKQQLRSGQKAI